MANFTLNGIEYKSNEKGTYFYKSTGKKDSKGNSLMMRIPKHVYEQAWDEYINSVDEADEEFDAEDEIRARKELEEEKDRETERNFNGYTRREVNKAVEEAIEKEMKKAKKSRRSKDVAFEMDTIEGHITLTTKQVGFLTALPKTNFWEDGVDSTLWCDCIADDIKWNPMSVGAMISTLREKKLVTVTKDESRQGHPKAMQFTIVGQVVAKKLGLK